MSEATGKDKITESERKLELLFLYKGNVILFNEMKEYMLARSSFLKGNINPNISYEEAVNSLSEAMISDLVFSPCEQIYLFHHEPFKVVKWIGLILKHYEKEFADHLLKLILSVLTDKTRFPQKNGQLEYVKNELIKLDVNEIAEPAILNPKDCWINYFTGKHSFDLKSFLEAFLSVRGLIKTEDQIVQEFIKDHYNEVIKQTSFPILNRSDENIHSTKDTKIFLSYCWLNQNSSDTIENDLSKVGISIVRDKNEVKYKDSLNKFMNRVRCTDFVIILLSKEYIESISCLYELFELFKEKDFTDRILPIIVSDVKFFKSIDRINFIKFWEERKSELEELLKTVSALNAPSVLDDLRFVSQVCLHLDSYLAKLADMKHLTLDQMRNEGYSSLFKKIGFENITYLIELLEISLIEDLNKREIALDKYFDTNSPNAYSLAIRAELASKKGNTEKAKLNYHKSLELEPLNKIALNNLGYLYDKKLNDYKSAKAFYEKAIEIDSHFIVAKLNLGTILTHYYGDTETPKRFYEEIIKDDPEEARAYNNLANIYFRNGDCNHAKELIEKALLLKPDYYDALINYAGLMHVQFNDKDAALQSYRKAKTVAYNQEAAKIAQTLINSIEKKGNILASENLKTPRNVQCPCGSGKKFKYCHGKN